MISSSAFIKENVTNARFIISSRAKRACITRPWQGPRDFLLAINLSSLVGVRLDVIKSSDVKVHYGFPGNQLPRWLFMKRGFSSVTQCLRQMKDNSKLNNSEFNKWLEIVAGKDLQTELRKTENIDFKFRASNGTAKANAVNWRLRM